MGPTHLGVRISLELTFTWSSPSEHGLRARPGHGRPHGAIQANGFAIWSHFFRKSDFWRPFLRFAKVGECDVENAPTVRNCAEQFERRIGESQHGAVQNT